MSQTFDPNAILIIHPSHPSMRQQRYLRRFRAWMRALALLILLCLIYPAPAVSETLRLASYTAALERNALGSYTATSYTENHPKFAQRSGL